MKVKETQPVSGKYRIIYATLASVLLASCSTSDSNSMFGFSPNDPASLALVSPAATGGAQNGTEHNASSTTYVMDENNPRLPQDIANVPVLRDGTALQPVHLTEQPQTQESVESIIATASEQAPANPLPPVAQQEAATAPAEQPQQDVAYAQEAPEKRSFFSTLFGSQPARAATKVQPTTSLANATLSSSAPAIPAPKPVAQIAVNQPVTARSSATASPLPGVRQNSLFEISRRNGMDDDSDVDLYESESEGSYQVASAAAGLARLAPNGLTKQTDRVDVACLKPSLVRVLKTVENHYKRKVVVTSGYRSPGHNRKARGARNSLHMYCAAADIQVAGVSKWDLAQFVRTMPGRGGVGTYCHTDSVHVDVGPERDWNWRCRRRK